MEHQELNRGDISENVIAIKVSRSFKEDMPGDLLYEITRGYWKVDPDRAKQAEYAFCVYKGVIKEVYEIREWLPAGSVPRLALPDAAVPKGRYEFIGTSAKAGIREKYLGKSIANLYRKGEANPIKYFLNDI